MKNRKPDILKKLSSDPDKPLVDSGNFRLMPLPGESGTVEKIRPLSGEERLKYECSLDGVSALCIPKPKSKTEETALVHSFLQGFKKLLSHNDNWTFWQPLMQSLDNCVGCQLCSEACPIFIASGREEIYRPTFRANVMRAIRQQYINDGGVIWSWLFSPDITLNWTVVARLAELAYRCTLCRRCAQVCPMGVDNGLIARELRKLFSQEMGIAPKELHDMGTMAQLQMPSMHPPEQLNQMIQVVEDEIALKLGRHITLPIDRKGADFLFIQTSMDSPSWLKCPECFAIIFEKAGLSWTLSSELGFGGANFGLWYDDIQFARIVHQQMNIAKKLGVKNIVLGECGHAFKGMASVAERIIPGDQLIPRMSWLPLVADIVDSGVLDLDPSRNDFTVTLHDPCNIARQMGLVEPQRRIVSKVCRFFKEMEPHGVNNYCCGGGSGLVVMSQTNFPEWRACVAGRFKMKQILDVFSTCLDPMAKKYVCAPCFTCKLEMNHLLGFYNSLEKYGISYGGLVELVVNAMREIKEPIVNFA